MNQGFFILQGRIYLFPTQPPRCKTRGGELKRIFMSENNKTGSKLKIFLGLLFVIGLFVLFKMLPVQAYLKSALDWIDGLGPTGPLVFILVYIAATVLFIPGSLLTLGAGFVFGVVKGTIYVSAGSILGATAAFLVGRYFARDWVSKKIEGNDKFKAMDVAVAKDGWKIVGLTRLSPLFPFTLLNYAYGLTKVSLKHYFFASWGGMVPGTIMYVYIGSGLESLATLGAGGGAKSTGEWVLFGFGLLATVIVTIKITKIAKKALSQKVTES